MPTTYKRKRATRNTRNTRRRYTRRTAVRRSMRMPPAAQSYKFTRMLAGTGNTGGALSLTGNAVYAPYIGAMGVTLGQVVNSADFANLFDQYKITYAKAKWYLSIDPGAQTATTANYPKLFWCRDFDDDTTVSSLNDLRENVRTKVAVLRPDRPVVIGWKPNVLRTVYGTAVASTYTPAFNQWVDMSQTSTKHYGYKFAIDNLTNTAYKVEVEIQLWFECKNAR